MSEPQPVPPPRSLGSGIHIIPVPLPFKSPPWVNVYLVEASEGFLMIDCGTDWDPGRKALDDGMTVLGLAGAEIHTLLVSHLHPDHVGMSARLVREWGCSFVMHERASRLVDRYNDTPGYAVRLERIASKHGVPETIVEANTGLRRPEYMPPIDPPDVTVADGDEISLGPDRSLIVLHTPGHEPAHICVRDTQTGILFSGDHILPRISPVIMYDEDIGDPLGEYMQSLNRLIQLGIALTYPAHGTLIERGDERAHQILLHHRRRLSDMVDLVRNDPSTAWSVMRESFRPNLDPVQARLAFLETVSHLVHLSLTGRLHTEDRDGTFVYKA